MNESRWAVNLLDLDMLDQLPVQLLVAPHIKSREIVRYRDRPDEMGIILECPEKQAKAICVLCATRLSERSNADYPCRVYRVGPQGGVYRLSIRQIAELDAELKRDESLSEAPVT